MTESARPALMVCWKTIGGALWPMRLDKPAARCSQLESSRSRRSPSWPRYASESRCRATSRCWFTAWLMNHKTPAVGTSTATSMSSRTGHNPRSWPPLPNFAPNLIRSTLLDLKRLKDRINAFPEFIKTGCFDRGGKQRCCVLAAYKGQVFHHLFFVVHKFSHA